MKIVAQNLHKVYKGKIALNEVSLSISKPKIYGLLGRNGAGKTTFMQLLAGYMQPDDGILTVDGKVPFDNKTIIENICLIKESGNFKKDLTIGQMLKISAYFYPHWNDALAEQLLETFSLDRKSYIKGLSKGMESALGITIGLASNAPITMLDEPYIGLDAASRSRFYELLLEEFERNPRTFILSTHLIDEVSNLFEEVIIFHEGNVLLHETSETLQQNSYRVAGASDNVKAYVSGKRVVKEKQFAGTYEAFILDENQPSPDHMLKISPVALQEMMVYLTERKS